MLRAMNEQRPLPLRPDRAALRAADRRSFVRACTALALSSNPASNRTSDAVLKAWRDDATAARFLKAAQTPTGTGDFPQAVATVVLPLLAPSSASARLMSLAASIDLTGISTVSLPYVGATGRPPVPFIPEGSPGSARGQRHRISHHKLPVPDCPPYRS
jgi:hypothetical protein